MKINAHLNFDGARTLKKLGEGDVYRCVTSLILLTTLCKHLGTEETHCSSFERVLK